MLIMLRLDVNTGGADLPFRANRYGTPTGARTSVRPRTGLRQAEEPGVAAPWTQSHQARRRTAAYPGGGVHAVVKAAFNGPR